jgi:hypothetical protein
MVYPRAPTLYEVKVISLGRSPADAVGTMAKRVIVIRKANVNRM